MFSIHHTRALSLSLSLTNRGLHQQSENQPQIQHHNPIQWLPRDNLRALTMKLSTSYTHSTPLSSPYIYIYIYK